MHCVLLLAELNKFHYLEWGSNPQPVAFTVIHLRSCAMTGHFIKVIYWKFPYKNTFYTTLFIHSLLGIVKVNQETIICLFYFTWFCSMTTTALFWNMYIELFFFNFNMSIYICSKLLINYYIKEQYLLFLQSFLSTYNYRHIFLLSFIKIYLVF